MNNNVTSNDSWNLPISREEWEEIMEREEIMRLVFEEEQKETEEMRMMQRSFGHYADDRDYINDSEEEEEYR